MLAIGVDIIEVERIARAHGRFGHRFLGRIFTNQEKTHCAGQAPRLAGRFAIKEAVAKALGTGIGDINWTDIEVVNNTHGQPILHLHNAAATLAARQGLTIWAISLSHTTTHAVGMAVGMKDPSTSGAITQKVTE